MGLKSWLRTFLANTLPDQNNFKRNSFESYSAFSGFPSHSFRLTHWPQMSDSFKTANVYRVLSVMSTKPVSWDWLCISLDQNNANAITLLQQLEQLKALEVLQVHYTACAQSLQKVIDLELKSAALRTDMRKSASRGR